MTQKDFHPNLYSASLKALTANGVPEDLAQKVSHIVASDTAGLPNFGRTPEDQALVNQAMQIFWSNERAKQ